MSEPEIILYDLPSSGRNSCWSLNPWKTRLILNYKGIPYKTTWVEYPDIEPTLSPHLPPNPSPAIPYTIPSIRSGSTYIMDSRAIAAHLEASYPSPPLHLDSPVLPEVQSLLSKLLEPLRGVWMPRVPKNMLNPVSKEYFERTRAERLGKTLEVFEKEEGGDEAWVEALPGAKALGEVLGREEGPYVLGKEVSYADFVLVAALHSLMRMDKALYERVVSLESKLGTLYDGCKQWLERDDR